MSNCERLRRVIIRGYTNPDKTRSIPHPDDSTVAVYINVSPSRAKWRPLEAGCKAVKKISSTAGCPKSAAKIQFIDWKCANNSVKRHLVVSSDISGSLKPLFSICASIWAPFCVHILLPPLLNAAELFNIRALLLSQRCTES